MNTIQILILVILVFVSGILWGITYENHRTIKMLRQLRKDLFKLQK